MFYKSMIVDHLEKCHTCKKLSDHAFAIMSTHAMRFNKQPGEEFTEEEAKVIFNNCKGCRNNYQTLMEVVTGHMARIGVFLN